ncbi:MAG: oligogalacturonate lyase family protein [Candidatus Poribacteria bacterium]|nr:oligogalacturonate lyase family protein [Candidatus Poribacteria bacterium]
MAKGDSTRGESSRLRDEHTDAEIIRLTDLASINHTLYFTNSSVAADNRRVVFVSDRDGGWNLFAADLEGNEIVQLTDSSDVNPFSPCLDRGRNRAYYTSGGQVRAIRLDDLNETTLANFDGATLGGCHLNADSTQLVTVVRREGVASLASVRTNGLGYDVFFDPPREVGHAQFCPSDDAWVMYSSGIDQRIWCVTIRGWKDRPVYLHDASQWITHESWLGQSETILFTKWNRSLMAVDRNGDNVREIARFNAWHASSRWDGSLIVADTVHPDIGLQLIDAESGRRSTLCHPRASSKGWRWTHNTAESGNVTADTYGPQWTHPHPAFSPNGEWVTFTSDYTGHPQIYATRIPDVKRWDDVPE